MAPLVLSAQQLVGNITFLNVTITAGNEIQKYPMVSRLQMLEHQGPLSDIPKTYDTSKCERVFGLQKQSLPTFYSGD